MGEMVAFARGFLKNPRVSLAALVIPGTIEYRYPKSSVMAAPNSKRKQKTVSDLGRLTALGPREPWQVALLLPRTWDEIRPVVTVFDQNDLLARLGEAMLVRGRLLSPPSVHYQPIPRVTAQIVDDRGRRISFTIFGNTGQAVQELTQRASDLCLWGTLEEYRGEPQLGRVEIVNPVWAGRLRPRYPGKPSVIGADLVRERVVRGLRAALPAAEAFLVERVADGDARRFARIVEAIAGEAIAPRQLLTEAHVPRSREVGERAHKVLDQLSAIAIVEAALREVSARGATRWRYSGAWRQRAGELPFALKHDQTRAIEEILADLDNPVPMHRLLAGDVGTGKTAVYGVVAATSVDAGARVAVLAPNTGLVAQIAANFNAWWPDLEALAVTGATSNKVALAGRRLLVGTTALLHRDIGERDLVVVDEQHKFSRAQREDLLRSGCHLLEATATCTPRSQALVELGVRQTSRLYNRAVERQVKTRIWHPAERADLMRAIEDSVGRGEQVLVILPKRGDEAKKKVTEAERRRQAAQAIDLWEKHFPGRVRLTHGGQKNAEKTAALDAMRTGEADVLVSTTVVEVGIDLPRLQRVVVIQANRLGLVTLHQIRGRVARGGGIGYCDLYLLEDGVEVERLNVLCETDDGFEIAEKDLRLRGFGDLSVGSTLEKGFEEGLLFQRRVEVEHVEGAVRLLEGEQE